MKKRNEEWKKIMSNGFKSGKTKSDGTVIGGRYHLSIEWLHDNFGPNYHNWFFHGSTGHFQFDENNNTLYVNHVPFKNSVSVVIRNYDTTKHATNEGYFSMAPTKIKVIANAVRFDYQLKIGV